MERLSGLDASFLYIESPSQPLHVCSILELDTSTVPGGYTFEHLRDELASRIAAIPEFRAKLADSQLNLDYPVWVEDEEFDLDRHLLRIGLPEILVQRPKPGRLYGARQGNDFALSQEKKVFHLYPYPVANEPEF